MYALLLLLGACFCAYASASFVEYAPEIGSDVCLKPSCVSTTREMIQALDISQDPCEDFYKFACGGWVKNNPIPVGESLSHPFSKLGLRNELIIRNALEKVNIRDPVDAETKARIYYDACIDTNNTKEVLGKKPLVDIIKKLGGWHLLPGTVGTQGWNLQRLVQDVQNRYNLGGLIQWTVSQDPRNSSQHVITVDQGPPSLVIRSGYATQTAANKKILDFYLDYMTRVCVSLGANETEAREEMHNVILFNTELDNITVPSEDTQDLEKRYNISYTIESWQKQAPFLNWSMFFNDAFKLVNKTIPNTERIVVSVPKYYEDLTRLIAKFSETKEGQRTLTSYMMWQVCGALSKYLSKPFRVASNKLQMAVSGSVGTQESWRHCVSDTDATLGFAVSAMFVREVFHGESKAQVKTMIENVRTAFKNNLKHLNWLDSETREAAELKADAITDMIGYPDYILNKEELDKTYEEFQVKPNEPFENYIAFKVFTMKNKLKKLYDPVDRNKWQLRPHTVNAYYLQENNQMVFPAGILQRPFYVEDNPMCINYGAIGSIMGHELTHAFDNQGMQRDRFGNLKQWWNNEMIAAFKKQTKCMEAQYSNYSIIGVHLNGKKTLGENIADNGGIKASFHAYLEYSKKTKQDVRLPGLKYNDRQLFFISCAQTWCSASTEQYIKFSIEEDVHTIGKYRVIGALSNLREFSEEFQCKPGTIMNPINKCEVW